MNNFKNLLNLLNTKQKFLLFLLFIFSNFIVFLELISIGAAYPFILSILNPKELFSSEFFLKLVSYFQYISNLNIQEENFDHLTLIYLSIGILALVFFVRMFFGLLYNVFFIKVYNNIILSFREKKIKKFLSNFKYNQNINSTSIFLRSVIQDIENSVTYLFNFITIIKDILFVLILISTLIYLYGFSTLLILLVFIIISLLIFFSVRFKMIIDANNRQKLVPENTELLQQIFNTFKTIITSNKQNFFKDIFISKNKSLIKTVFFKSVFDKSFKFIFEFILILFVSIIIFAIINDVNDIDDRLPKIAIFFIILLRLSPSFQGIINTFQDNVFKLPATNSFLNFIKKNTIKRPKINTKNKINKFKKIQVKNLTFSYSNDQTIFKNYNLILKSNNPIFIFGKSGIGKSTLISLILGFMKPSKGQILIDNKQLKTPYQFDSQSVGIVPQHTFILNDSVISNIAFGIKKENFDYKKLNIALKLSDINSKTFKGLNIKNSKLGENGCLISGGQRQRIALARLIYQNPKLVILDESTNSLDRVSELKILKNLIRWCARDKMLIAITHSIPKSLNKISKIQLG